MTQVRQLEAHSQIPEVKTEQLAHIIDKSLNNILQHSLQETLQSTLENTLQSYFQTALAQKVSHAELATKVERTELDLKADRTELEQKAERAELASKVSHAELEHKVDYISLTSLLEGKVSHQDLDKKLESRVDVTSFHKELESRVDITSFHKALESRVDVTSFHKALELRVDYDSLKINLETKADKETLIQIKQQTRNNETRLNDYKINLMDNQRRLNLLLEEARKRLPEPFSEQQLNHIADQETHIFDAMYVAFEDKFRGTRKDIKNRQKTYLPIIKKALKATDNKIILDMGCGRGEWLELLQENKIKAEGIDLNCIMITECHQQGLTATEADILDYLRPLKPASVSAVTGFHIIEHLSFKVLIALFDECLRVLKPGGIIIFETPNPENLLVGACHFYTDPSHHNPLVPETMRFTIEQRGFEKTDIKRLHKYSDFYETTSDDPFIKAHFYNEMDYAIIGYKV
jgi:O-antigen chain-terminating methyltransferase